MNETIRLLNNHRSIRKYSDRPVTTEQLHTIIAAGQSSSTSSNMQAYSVVRITDMEIRKQLAQLSGPQHHVEEAPEFLVWCGDLNRIHVAVDGMIPSTTVSDKLALSEHFIIATVDAALAAQNSAIAAESLGLGILYVGGIRNHITKVAELLQLPDLVYPLFGMCIGYAAEEPLLRPRLPQEAVLHENVYDSNKQREYIGQYNEVMKSYVRERSNGKQQFNWSEAMAKRLEGKQREDILPFLHSKQVLKK
ncbi:oxygen-insensitive NADPH nitroreductase [Paenibacillus sp. FSL W7-1287]|uniref:oxygen-insensitive NADPH nitroreductase n=1 Tax=Paenibacillus sp. FSL W7-1287 TaxID=2954538 RepID=UPI0030FAE3E0